MPGQIKRNQNAIAGRRGVSGITKVTKPTAIAEKVIIVGHNHDDRIIYNVPLTLSVKVDILVSSALSRSGCMASKPLSNQRVLTAEKLIERVCHHFGCEQLEPLAQEVS